MKSYVHVPVTLLFFQKQALMPDLCGLSMSLSSSIRCHACSSQGVSGGGIKVLLHKEVTSLVADSGLGTGEPQRVSS